MRAQLKALIADPRKTLKVYALGALLFFIGVGLVQWADKLIEPSVEQEGYMLLGIIVIGCGFSIAIFAQIIMIIHRFNKLGD